MITSGAAEAPFVGRLRGVLKRHFTTEVLERVGGRTSTDRVGENVTGRSLGKTAGSDLRRTCGRLGEAGRHARCANGLRAETLTDWGLQNCSYGNFLDVWGCYPPSLKSFRGRLGKEI
ncbi:UNVERIFIED_CONTAM: hypothetical protein Sindi_2939800 [Sesamum indicum]